MSILGNKYGSWTVIEEHPKKIKGCWMVTVECACGKVQLMQRSPFVHGSNSEKCFKCHLNNMKKNFRSCSDRFF